MPIRTFLPLLRSLALACAVLAVSPQPAAAGARPTAGGPGAVALASIRGRIVDARTGKPLRDVLVVDERSRREAKSDAEGRFALDELAEGPHSLVFSLVGYALVKRTIELGAAGAADLVVHLPEGASTYAEEVLVTAGVFARPEPGVPAQQALGSAELQALRGVLADDPMRAVQSLPGVATGDDFRSEFTVRGSDFRHVGVSVDGVPTSRLLHLMPGIEDTGSLAMINSDVLDSVTLLAGSHPQRFGSHTGAQVDFRLRSGSRDRTAVRAAASATNASIVAEGPLGGARRGSWLVSARYSYLQWVVDRVAPDIDSTIGFTDTQAKLVFDHTRRHQVELAAIGGVTTLRQRDAGRGPNSFSKGRNGAGMATAVSRLTLASSAGLTQRLSLVVGDFDTVNTAGQRLDSGTQRELGYRADLTTTPTAWSLIEAGISVLHVRSDGRSYTYDAAQPARFTLDAFGGNLATTSLYSLARLARGTLTASPGVRVDHWTNVARAAASPWLQVDWAVSPRWRLTGGAGLYRQPPPLEATGGPRGTRGLRDERARHIDLGVEHEMTPHTRWRLTLYDRQERDVLRLPDDEDRLDGNGRLVRRSTTTHWAQPLAGTARGAELLWQRSSPQGLAGWIGYSYGISRYDDRSTGETFDGNADQRHTLNLQGSYRFSSRLNVGAKFRAGSNLPVVGYYRRDGDEFFLSARRNTLRLPFYSRLDLRAAQTFALGSRRLTLFVEVLNVYNRHNYGPTAVNVNRRTLEATGLIEDLLPILPSAGVTIEF